MVRIMIYAQRPLQRRRDDDPCFRHPQAGRLEPHGSGGRRGDDNENCTEQRLPRMATDGGQPDHQLIELRPYS
jgi:hypothetical protein